MPTFKVYHDTRRLNADGCAIIRLVLRSGGKAMQISTGIAVKPDEWNGHEVINHPNKGTYNRHIQQFKIRVEDIALDYLRKNADKKISLSTLKSVIQQTLNPQEQTRNTFLAYYSKFAESRKADRTKEIYRETAKRIRSFDNKADRLLFEDITITWLTDFDKFLETSSPSANARNIHFRNIRAVFNDARDNEITAAYPFRKFKMQTVPTRKRSMSKDILRKVFDAELEPWLIKYQDIFKLTFYLIGINFVDLCNLKEIKDGRIEYFRAKTNKYYSIKIEPEALAIINKYRGENYLLNFLDGHKSYRVFYNTVTQGLRKIAKTLNIDELTTYWARHSWASIASELDVPIDTIAAALGHSHGNQVTAIYINFNQRKIDDANRKVIDYLLGNR